MKIKINKLLKNKNFKNVKVYEIANVITDSGDEAFIMDWLQFFEDDKSCWYYRSVLGGEFG
jgi:hypothetical protein